MHPGVMHTTDSVKGWSEGKRGLTTDDPPGHREPPPSTGVVGTESIHPWGESRESYELIVKCVNRPAAETAADVQAHRVGGEGCIPRLDCRGDAPVFGGDAPGVVVCVPA